MSLSFAGSLTGGWFEPWGCRFTRMGSPGFHCGAGIRPWAGASLDLGFTGSRTTGPFTAGPSSQAACDNVRLMVRATTIAALNDKNLFVRARCGELRQGGVMLSSTKEANSSIPPYMRTLPERVELCQVLERLPSIFELSSRSREMSRGPCHRGNQPVPFSLPRASSLKRIAMLQKIEHRNESAENKPCEHHAEYAQICRHRWQRFER